MVNSGFFLCTVNECPCDIENSVLGLVNVAVSCFLVCKIELALHVILEHLYHSAINSAFIPCIFGYVVNMITAPEDHVVSESHVSIEVHWFCTSKLFGFKFNS